MGMGVFLLGSDLFFGCRSKSALVPHIQSDFRGKVLIIGAGAAGMAAGYYLKNHGVDFAILEASNAIGGRLKKVEGFVDFPLDLGAEWIHTHPRFLSELLINKERNSNVQTLVYNPQTIATWKAGELKYRNFIRHVYSEWKFAQSTWFDFFDQNIVPEIKDLIFLNRPVSEIQYGGDKVIVSTRNGEEFISDKVLITASIKMLQNRSIRFVPALPSQKQNAIDELYMGDGIKVFIEFKERFYPDVLTFGNIFQAFREEEKFYYDAAFRKETQRHVLGLFAINEKASSYTELKSEKDIIQKILNELDGVFEGKATPNYVQHVVQNWSAQPFVEGAYSYTVNGPSKATLERIIQPVMKKVFFAGEALSIENQSMVHGAIESAYHAAERIITD